MSDTRQSRSAVSATARAELVCPRCDYSLRGLPSPRCPECGVEFRWEDLADVNEARASGFFEYCLPSDFAKCFAHTWWRALHPVSFWNWATPSWPARQVRVLLFAALLFSTTIVSLTLVLTALTYGMLYWYHGRFGWPSVSAFVGSFLPLYGLTSVGHVLPCLVVGALLWCYRGTIAQSRFRPRRLLRLVAYPASFLPLLAIAVPARIVSTLFAYASRPNADWATMFWWLQPNGHWSEMVYARIVEFDWFKGSFEWSNPLRFVTVAAITALFVPLALPRLRTARLARALGLVVLILLWPVAMLYAGWFVSVIVGAQRCLPGPRAWAVGLVSGAIGLVCLLAVNTLFGGRALFDLLLAWP